MLLFWALVIPFGTAVLALLAWRSLEMQRGISLIGALALLVLTVRIAIRVALDARVSTMAAAISRGSPNRPAGIWSPMRRRWSSVRTSVIGLAMKPGATQFAVIPRPASSAASDLVIPTMPALLAA